MKFKNLFVLLSIGILLCGCGEAENNKKKTAAAEISSMDFIIKFIEEKNLKLDFDADKLQYIQYATIPANAPSSKCVIDYLVKYAKYIKVEMKNKDGKIISSCNLKIGDLQLKNTEIQVKNQGLFTTETILFQDGKVIYKDVNDDTKTKLSAEQLLQLLERNGLNIKVITTLKTEVDKSMLFIIKSNR